MMTPAHFPEPPLLSATPASGAGNLRLMQHGIHIIASSAARFRRAEDTCRPGEVGPGRRDLQPQRNVSIASTAQTSGSSPNAAP
ncbi:MAG TPA: hypothetical protein VGN97_23875 [Mesorhizobium sp.]|jgi:hypothetical protein|nr:hypothetical protein [Mesorhizobium sp.]